MDMRTLNVGKMIEESKFNRFHFMVLFLLTFIIVFDGFDLVVFGAVVPVLMKDWGLTPIQAGALGSYTLIGTMIGTLIFGLLADKVGRKSIILVCFTLFSVFTGLIWFANNPTVFGVFRFIGGLGLGGVLPNVIALMTEYSPKKWQSISVTIIEGGYALGSAIAATVAIFVIPNFGWRPLFLVGAIPLLTLPILYKYLPESPRFYLAKNKKEKLTFALTQIIPGFTPKKGDEYEITMPEKSEFPVASLFKNKRALSTSLIWFGTAFGLLMVYGLNTWLPKFMQTAGYALGSSLAFLVVLNFGAIFGGVFGGWLSDRWNGRKVVIFFTFIAAAAFILLSFKTNTFITYLLIFVAGATTIGTTYTANAYISQYYPSKMRSTGVGWALGIGRIGAVLGPTLGGVLLTMNLPIKINFLILAVPGLIVALTFLMIKDRYSNAYTADINKANQIVEQPDALSPNKV
jgi:MFS transporter, AAHS family, benzoate transport protein